jgi:hypothetical protein
MFRDLPKLKQIICSELLIGSPGYDTITGCKNLARIIGKVQSSPVIGGRNLMTLFTDEQFIRDTPALSWVYVDTPDHARALVGDQLGKNIKTIYTSAIWGTYRRDVTNIPGNVTIIHGVDNMYPTEDGAGFGYHSVLSAAHRAED